MVSVLWADGHLGQVKVLYPAQGQLSRCRQWGTIGEGFRGQTLLARWLEVIHQVIAQLVDTVSDTLKCGEGRSDRHSSEGVKTLFTSA